LRNFGLTKVNEFAEYLKMFELKKTKYILNTIQSNSLFVILQFLEESLKIGELYKTESGESQIIGQAPLGFPVNTKIEHLPPVLFSINCHDYHVGFSDFVPYMCLTTASDGSYKVNTRPWKDHFKSDLRSDQVHRQKNDLRSDQEDLFF
jgi:hypothetical protein